MAPTTSDEDLILMQTLEGLKNLSLLSSPPPRLHEDHHQLGNAQQNDNMKYGLCNTISGSSNGSLSTGELSPMNVRLTVYEAYLEHFSSGKDFPIDFLN